MHPELLLLPLQVSHPLGSGAVELEILCFRIEVTVRSHEEQLIVQESVELADIAGEHGQAQALLELSDVVGHWHALLAQV